jgi:hypothetical protein
MFGLQDMIKSGNFDAEQIAKIVEDLNAFRIYLSDVLDVANDVDEKGRSEEFLRRLSQND